MKIGLLAYHSAINFGATLQLLSTYMFLKNKGYLPIVINWISEDMEYSYESHTIESQLLCQKKIRETIWTETKLCRTDDDVASVILQEKIEAVIIGSDAVCQHHTEWERLIFPCKRIVAIEHATSDRLFPNPFWATWNELLPKKVPVALLSASSQDSEYKFFSNQLCRQMAKQIEQYSYVSVRDTWTKKMFCHITKNKVDPEVTPDPVFAFKYNAEGLLPNKSEILDKYELPEKYILMSFINATTVSQKWLDEFQILAAKDGYTCVKLPFSQKESFGRLNKEIHLPLSPIDWFALIKYSSGYIGHNMHPIVVSIHNSVPFFSFDNYGLKRLNGIITTDKSSKIKHLLDSAGLAEWRVSCISKTFKSPCASYVYDKFKNFNSSSMIKFADDYYAKYLGMMNNILNSFQN